MPESSSNAKAKVPPPHPTCSPHPPIRHPPCCHVTIPPRDWMRARSSSRAAVWSRLRASVPAVSPRDRTARQSPAREMQKTAGQGGRS